MNRLILRTVLFFVFIVSSATIASAWQPNGWVYRSGSSQLSVEEGDWFWNDSAWNQWVVGMSTGEWQNTSVDGWCYYNWPYFWANSAQQWYYTAEPGDQAWSVNLRTEQWSIYGDDDLASVAAGQLYLGNFSGASTGEFIAIVGPDQSAFVLAYDDVYGEFFTAEALLGSVGALEFSIGDFEVTGTASGPDLSATGTSLESGTINITGTRVQSGDLASLSGYYTGSEQDLEGTAEYAFVISPDGRVYYYESHSYWGEGVGFGTVSASGAFQISDSWDESYEGTVSLEGTVLSVTDSLGTITVQRQFSFETE